MRFAQMLLNRGQMDGVRLLAPSTVALMTSDHTPKTVGGGTFTPIRPGIGFGYDCAVAYDPLEAGVTLGKGSYWWNGLAGTAKEPEDARSELGRAKRFDHVVVGAARERVDDVA